MSEDSRAAIWQHYYTDRAERDEGRRRRLKRIPKKEIIYRTLKRQASQGETLSLQELSEMTGLSCHVLSGHLTHLVNEGKVVRTARGVFALAGPAHEGRSQRDELKSLIESIARSDRGSRVEEKIVIRTADHSESRRMLIDFLNDSLLLCAEVEVHIRCAKDKETGEGRLTIELRAD